MPEIPHHGPPSREVAPPPLLAGEAVAFPAGGGTWPRAGIWSALLAWGILALGHLGAAEFTKAQEHQVKAAFLYNFIKFVEWPAGRFDTPSSPFVIGVVGNSPFRASLEAVLQNRKLNGRDIVVRTVDDIETAKKVHLLFCPGAEERLAADLLPTLGEAGLLTVTESVLAGRWTGIIHFTVEEERVRFEVDLKAAEQAGLKVSAQLLKLAKTVRR